MAMAAWGIAKTASDEANGSSDDANGTSDDANGSSGDTNGTSDGANGTSDEANGSSDAANARDGPANEASGVANVALDVAHGVEAFGDDVGGHESHGPAHKVVATCGTVPIASGGGVPGSGTHATGVTWRTGRRTRIRARTSTRRRSEG